MENKSNYRSIVKGTAIFGGVQIFTIIVNVIKGKLVALLLGPEGMGISSLFTTAMNSIQQFSGLGLPSSIVREISINSADDETQNKKREEAVYISRTLAKASALLGALICMIFSSYISKMTFGDTSYKWHFVALAFSIAITALSNAEMSILQGMHAIKRLAYSSIVGSSTGLLVGIPLYYFFGYNGIVPAIIALSIATYVFYRYNTHKSIQITISSVDKKTFWETSKRMISLGVVLMISILFGSLTVYGLNTFIRAFGSVSDVGLYQAANTIANQYVGLVFSAMAVDYYPRLMAAQADTPKMNSIVNQQIEIIMLIVTPLVAILILTAPILINVLLTDEFNSVIVLIRWMGFGIFFKALAYPMSYISFSKGDKRTFFWLEGVSSNLVNIAISCSFYYIFGINGLGMSLTITCIIFNVVYIILTRRLYEFHFDKAVLKLVLKLCCFAVIVFVSSFIESVYIKYSIGIVTLILLSIYSLIELNKRIDLKETLRKITKRG